MNTLTRVFLVLLRLAIGWHFFFEGVEKINSLSLGETTTNRPFSSAGYLGEATGPFADFFRDQVRESDEEVLNRLTVVPLASGQDATMTPPHTRMPPGLAKEWKDYFDRFVREYRLDSRQADLAEKKLYQREDNTVRWLLEGRKRITKTFPTGTVEVEQTTAQRIEDYRNKVQEVRDMQTKLIPDFGKDVLKEKFRAAKTEANQMRLQLLADLNEQTEYMKKSLKEEIPSILGPSTVGLAASPFGAGPISAATALRSDQGEEILTPDQKLQRQLPAAQYASSNAVLPLQTLDKMVAWGTLLIGACLLLGLFSRTACLGGAAFLLMLYLAMPPFPWLPDPPRPLEGHYLFVSKNLIEMIALLTLATTRSGRWAGLDALVQFLNPWRRRQFQEKLSQVPIRRSQEHAAIHRT